MAHIKRCPKCEKDLPTTSFSYRDAEHRRIQSYCRDCQNEAWRRWYASEQNRRRHKALVRDRRRRRRDRHRQIVLEAKAVPCADCGVQYAPHVMDFDHRIGGEPKVSAVSAMVHVVGTEALLAEIAKCDVVCANCHRERTHKRAGGSSAGR